MTSLQDHQRAMRDLIRGIRVADDPYIAAAAQCVGLEVTRDTIRGWRKFRLDRNCRLTSAILRQRGLYDEVFESIDRELPFIEELAAVFLEAAAARGDALVATVARFELALLTNDDVEQQIDWPCDPYDVLGPLLGGGEVPPLQPAPHRTFVSRAHHGLFRVEAM
jgi:hypothetical protein